MRACKRGREYSALGKILQWTVHEQIQRKKTPKRKARKKEQDFSLKKEMSNADSQI